jgi:hypothetical protein
MILQVPIRGVQFMVYEDNEKVRGFYTKSEAQHFISNNTEMTIKKLPQKFKTYEVEEAPF